MAQTRMFRDRVVSMEQTFEGGEKHLPLLREICGEAFPDFTLREHGLDHERDLFVMDLDGPGGQSKRVCWTRMMLFDAERIPTLTGDPASGLRAKIIDYLRARAGRAEIVVTFRHLEEGWIDMPEPRREGRRRRRGGRPRGLERGAAERRPASPEARIAAGGGRRPAAPAGGSPVPRGEASRITPGQPVREGAPPAPSPGGKRRRRFRRRRRGRGGGSSGSGAPPPAGSRA